MSDRQTTWTMYAGVYAVLAGFVMLSVFFAVVGSLSGVFGVSVVYAAFLLSFPAVITGSIAWWLVVENRRRYDYRNGVAFGVSAALLTLFVWVFVSVFVLGPRTVLAGGVVLAFVFGGTVIAGAIGGLPLIYARRNTTEE